ncbi:hypothetical protein ACIGBH_39000 [Streptomyces sp. NPDC085929]|uniref:hypothetical protein n=1 Tax=Streptomyces sp. NPDC085929 TaxID=3365739 RepID=UPI0037D3210E
MEDSETRPLGSHRRQRFEVVHKWSATATAVVALAISIYNFAELHRQPDIEMTLPHLFRLEKLGNGVRFYVRPTVSTRFKSENVEVIAEAQLRLTPAINHWSGDPAPFIVSQDKPQQPSFEFRANDWMYQAGRYEGSLVLLRSGDRAPLTKRFCLIISAAAANELQNPQPPDQTIRFFRNDLPKFASSRDAGCYRRDMD